jgi:hypothetical protein
VEKDQASKAHLFAPDGFLEGDFIVTDGRAMSRLVKMVAAFPIPLAAQ